MATGKIYNFSPKVIFLFIVNWKIATIGSVNNLENFSSKDVFSTKTNSNIADSR